MGGKSETYHLAGTLTLKVILISGFNALNLFLFCHIDAYSTGQIRDDVSDPELKHENEVLSSHNKGNFSSLQMRVREKEREREEREREEKRRERGERERGGEERERERERERGEEKRRKGRERVVGETFVSRGGEKGKRNEKQN